MKNKHFAIAIATLVLCLIGSMASAEGVKERMLNRVPALNALKADGVIGENNIGLLEYRGAELGLEVVASENQDRLMVYKAIAQKTGTTLDLVGQRRAVQIAESAPPGTWLQDSGGKWYQK